MLHVEPGQMLALPFSTIDIYTLHPNTQHNTLEFTRKPYLLLQFLFLQPPYR